MVGIFVEKRIIRAIMQELINIDIYYEKLLSENNDAIRVGNMGDVKQHDVIEQGCELILETIKYFESDKEKE